MKKLTTHMASLCALLVLCCACSTDGDDLGGGAYGNGGKTTLVNLDISVALSDVSDALTRSVGTGSATRAGENDCGHQGAASDNERMHTLRIVIVRPSGIVEANKLIDLADASAPGLDHYGKEQFLVVANETKRVYLFVNEETTVTNTTTNITRKLVDYDLGENSIKVDYLFPMNTLRDLKIKLQENNEQIEGPLPMSEMHEVKVENEDKECTLFVTRAAVKFTFNITNETNRPITLEGLKMNKMASEEWYMPRATYTAAQDGHREVATYEVPVETGYYIYNVVNPSEAKVLSAGQKEELFPIYLLEGKYTDEEDSRNYSVEMTVNGVESKHYLENLPTQLPRNTHVVVNIVITEHDIVLKIDLLPYVSQTLEPVFGLKS